MSSYDETDALVPAGVRVPTRPGVTLVSVPAAGPSASPPPARPATPPASPPPAAAQHPVQPQPVANDTVVVPPGVNVPRRTGTTLVNVPVVVSPPAPRSTPISAGTTSPSSSGGTPSYDDAYVPPGVNVPSRRGTTLTTLPAAGSTVSVALGAGWSASGRTLQGVQRTSLEPPQPPQASTSLAALLAELTKITNDVVNLYRQHYDQAGAVKDAADSQETARMARDPDLAAIGRYARQLRSNVVPRSLRPPSEVWGGNGGATPAEDPWGIAPGVGGGGGHADED